MAKKKNIEENVSNEISDFDVDEKDINVDDNFDDEDFGDVVVEMTDEEGNSYYYAEQMIIPVGDDRFALLVEMSDHDHECCGGHDHNHEECECGCEDGDVIIAKIVQDENGEDIYIEPTDEEFEAVQKAYDEMIFDDLDEDDLK